MKKTFKKDRKHKKHKSRHIKKYRKTNNTKHRHHRHHKHHKYHKSHKYMKGGAALYYGNQSAAGKPSSILYNTGNGSSARNTYVKHTDRPTGSVSYVNFTPQPLLNSLWTVQSGIKNFFNELLGNPKQSTPNPTNQPLGKTINPYIPKEISNTDLNNYKNIILQKFNS